MEHRVISQGTNSTKHPKKRTGKGGSQGEMAKKHAKNAMESDISQGKNTKKLHAEHVATKTP